MSTCLLPTMDTIHDTLVSEIAQLGGCVTDDIRCDDLLFMRSLLPHTDQVRSGDSVQGGVALRATEREVFVHPYTVRKVCENGAIMAIMTDTRRMVRVDPDVVPDEADEVLEDLRVAVQACAHKATLRDAVGAMRLLSEILVNQHYLIDLISVLSGPAVLDRGLIRAIMQRFARDRDRTLFGFMNAITSLARDTRDPETRWRLEELGGGVLALSDTPHLAPARRRLVPSR